jgi:hypothetical protein
MTDTSSTIADEFVPRSDWTVLAAVVAACLLVTLGAFALMRIGETATLRNDMPLDTRLGRGAGASTWVLEAVLTPAIDPAALPLKWKDPLEALGCARGSQLLIDDHPLQPGSAIPVVPFVMEWDARGCRPLGMSGPRVDGRARLTVFHEDWGFSGVVEPAAMRLAWPDGRIAHMRRGSGFLLGRE